METNYLIKPIGIIHSPYQEKFAIPRQSILNSVVKAEVELLPPYNCDQAIEGLDNISHLWIEFIFHQVPEDKVKLMVRPPRLGGNKKRGVLATRSPFRQNRIGLSLVKVEEIIKTKGKVIIVFSGVDMVDKTPVIDIKPYIPYADDLGETYVGYAKQAPQKKYQVKFSEQALAVCHESENLKDELDSILCFDLQPAYKNNKDKDVKFRFRNCEIVAIFSENVAFVKNITEIIIG